jgi:hypothetical protein
MANPWRLTYDVTPPNQLHVRTKESELQETVRKTATATGWLHYHPHRSDNSAAGFPDSVILKPPFLIFAELKRSREEPKPEQRAWLDGLNLVTTVTSLVIRPQDMDSFRDGLVYPERYFASPLDLALMWCQKHRAVLTFDRDARGHDQISVRAYNVTVRARSIVGAVEALQRQLIDEGRAV